MDAKNPHKDPFKYADNVAMIFEIRHQIEYLYTQPVYLEAHQLHLTPRSDAFQNVKRTKLSITPHPSTLTPVTDVFGNPAHEIWFTGSWNKLALECISQVETLCPNPFDFLLRSGTTGLPARYSKTLEPYLAPFLRLEGKSKLALTEDFAASIASRTGYETIKFLTKLCAEIKNKIRYRCRAHGAPMPSDQVLVKGEGACRDLAMLFINCCRLHGLAARFTSGYAIGDTTELGEVDLHAWAEVYLEGGGWRGFDPSLGLAVSNQHVALASAPGPEFVSPAYGSFRSNQATAQLLTQVTFTPLTLSKKISG